MIKQSLAIYSVEQIRALENRAIEQAKIAPEELMISAAKFCLTTLQQKWPSEKTLTIYCGTGNNGGDGLYLGLFAKEAGYQVEIVLLPPNTAETEQKYLSTIRLKLRQVGIEPVVYTSGFEPSGKILVDALLGIGLKGLLKPKYQEIITHINYYHHDKKVKVFSVDIPSGLDANTGGIADIAVKADITATFIGYKPGLLTSFGPEFSGEIFADKLTIPDAVFSDTQAYCQEITHDKFKASLPPRSKIAHKKDFGHVVVIAGGELQFAGAGVLSATAALKTGAGLVSLIVPSKSYVRISQAPMELMCYAIDNFNLDTAGFLAKADVIVMGPGLGQNAWSKQALTYVLTLNKQVIYDADALNLIAKDDLGVSMFLSDPNKSLFTPHPGEASRLLNTTIESVQLDRFDACKKISNQYHATVVLKGAGSLIYNQADQFALCTAANPALATAGTGDVLTGMIASLWAQGMSVHDAASGGVWLHAFLAEQQSQKIGQRGFVASDMVHAIPFGINQ
jgi:hydroxyethylthiazole kinase-like uncharacterized protein yjeF